MKNKKSGLIILLFILFVLPFMGIIIIENMNIINKDLKEIEATVIDVRETDNNYSVKIKYEFESKKYQQRIITGQKFNKEDILKVYYDRNNPSSISINNRRSLNDNEKIILYKIMGIVIFIDSIAIILFYRQELFSVISNENKSENRQHIISRYDTKNSQKHKEVVVSGKIIDIVQDKSSYSIVIEYEYDDDLYEFYVDGFNEKMISSLKKNNIFDVEVYLRQNHPDIVKIDEKSFKEKLK